MRLTDQQMLTLWRRACRLESARSDCSIDEYDGYNITAAMMMDMRLWYLNLLDTAELRHLVLTDITAKLKIKQAADGVWCFSLPTDTRRLVSIHVEGCAHTIVVINADDAQRLITLNSNRYSRSGMTNPVAILRGREVTLYCNTADGNAPTISSTQAVEDPGDEYYDLNESALSLIPKNISYINE